MPQPQTCRQENTAILHNNEGGGIAIICAGPEKKLQRCDKQTSWKSERYEKAKSAPTCCRQRHEYPRGYTLLECRLDGNQPIAQVVQVPSDTTDNIIHNKTCMLLETKQSESGPSSRVIAYPVGPNYKARPASGPQRPIKPVRTFNQPSKQTGLKIKANIGKRNGLSPTSSERQVPKESLLKRSRVRGTQQSEVPKSCSAQCRRPTSSPYAAFAVCGVNLQPCFSRTTPTSALTSKSAVPKAATCGCPVQHVCESADLPFSEMRPLPGGTVVPPCPPPSLPEISPVPFGVNNFRDHKPSGSKAKASGPRKPISAPPSTPGKPVKVILKPKKLGKVEVPKKKTKNKKTGSSGKHRMSLDTGVHGNDKPSTPDPVEKYVDCPASIPKKVQSVDVCENRSVVACPTLESKGSQCVRVCEKSSGVECPDFKSRPDSGRFHGKPCEVECPAFDSEKSQSVRVCENPVAVKCRAFEAEKHQSVRVCEKSTYVKGPRCKSKGNQSVRVCKNQLYVDCPAFDSRDNQLDLVPEEPSYMSHLERIKAISRSAESDFVKCPAFASRKSSETSSVYVPRDEVSVNKYPEHFRPKTLTTAVDHCAKRNRLQDECRPHIPQSVLRMSYEQRRNRHARTLLSSGSLCRRFDDEDTDMGLTFCVPSSKSRKQDQPKEPEGHRSVKDKKKDVEQIEKSVKSTPRNSPRTCKLGLKRVKSRELRAGVVYYDCDCYHRNGLQHDCPRGGCEGRNRCLTRPWPQCRLSCYFRRKWGLYNEVLDLTPPTAFCGPRDTLYRVKMEEEKCSKCQRPDDKSEKLQEDPPKTKGKPAKPTAKKVRKCKGEQVKECRQVHEDMVQHYAMIPVVLNQHCDPI